MSISEVPAAELAGYIFGANHDREDVTLVLEDLLAVSQLHAVSNAATATGSGDLVELPAGRLDLAAVASHGLAHDAAPAGARLADSGGDPFVLESLGGELRRPLRRKSEHEDDLEAVLCPAAPPQGPGAGHRNDQNCAGCRDQASGLHARWNRKDGAAG